MKMTDEELPEYLHGSNTLENAVWRLAVGLYQAQITHNKNSSPDKQLDIFSLEIKNEDGRIQGIIEVTNLPVELRTAILHFSAIEEIRIPGYKPIDSETFINPWGHGGGGLDTFFHLLFQLILFQVLEKYNPNSNKFIDLRITQSDTLKDYPLFISSTITLPVENILDTKEFICTPKEILIGESPWKITTL